MEPAVGTATQPRFERRGETTATGMAALLRLFIVPVFGFLCFFVVLATGIPWDRVALLGLATATGTLILTVVSLDRIRPRERRNLLFSLVSFSYFVFFVFPVFVFYLGTSGYESSPNPVPLTPPDVTLGVLAAFLGYVMLLLGFSLPLGRMAANFVPRMKREWSPMAGIAVALIAIPLGWFVVVGSQIGIIPQRAGSGVLGAVAQGASFGIGLIALVLYRYRSRIALLLLAIIVPMTMGFNFFTSSKGAFLRPLVIIAIVHVLITRQLRLWWIVGFVALAALIYPVSMAYRDYLYGNKLTAVEVIASPQAAFRLIGEVARTSDPVEYLKSGLESTGQRLNGLSMLSVIVRDAGNRVPLQGGWSIAYIPLSYVPRLLWAGKPRFETGLWVTDNFGFPGIDTSTGSTWLGEFYFNFGWIGLLVGMAFLGLWMRFLQDSFLRIDSTIPAMLSGIVTILVIAPNLGGDLLAPFNGVIFNVTPIVIMHWLVTNALPPPTRLPPPL